MDLLNQGWQLVLSGGIDIVLPFLAILTVIVFVHEMGHYLVARRNGVRIEVFSVGFGPELFGWSDSHGTRWKFSLVPLGGYVKMMGDANAASQPGEADGLTAEERAQTLAGRPLGQRAAIVSAGPIANFLLAIVLLAGLFWTTGQPYTPSLVAAVQPDSAAAAAGLLPGDRIVAVDGAGIDRFEDLQQIVSARPGERLVLTVERAGQLFDLEAIPERTTITDSFGNELEIGLLGISSSGVEYRELGPLTAVVEAVSETASMTWATLEALGEMIVGARDADQLGGPIRIAQMSGQVAEFGFGAVVFFMAVLSLNLGLINLFPIPMLDGGHLLFYAIEAARGRPLSERAQEYGFRIGLALVFSLMLFATLNDLDHLGLFGS